MMKKILLISFVFLIQLSAKQIGAQQRIDFGNHEQVTSYKTINDFHVTGFNTGRLVVKNIDTNKEIYNSIDSFGHIINVDYNPTLGDVILQQKEKEPVVISKDRDLETFSVQGDILLYSPDFYDIISWSKLKDINLMIFDAENYTQKLIWELPDRIIADSLFSCVLSVFRFGEDLGIQVHYHKSGYDEGNYPVYINENKEKIVIGFDSIFVFNYPDMEFKRSIGLAYPSLSIYPYQYAKPIREIKDIELSKNGSVLLVKYEKAIEVRNLFNNTDSLLFLNKYSTLSTMSSNGDIVTFVEYKDEMSFETDMVNCLVNYDVKTKQYYTYNYLKLGYYDLYPNFDVRYASIGYTSNDFLYYTQNNGNELKFKIEFLDESSLLKKYNILIDENEKKSIVSEVKELDSTLFVSNETMYDANDNYIVFSSNEGVIRLNKNANERVVFAFPPSVIVFRDEAGYSAFQLSSNPFIKMINDNKIIVQDANESIMLWEFE